MGYGIVLVLDDNLARNMNPGQVGRTLFDTVGTDPYPTTFPATTVGPWSAVGAFHATAPAVFRLEGLSLRTVPPDPVLEGMWVNQLSAGDHHRLIREAQRHPSRYSQRLARTGGSVRDAVMGPDLLASGQSLASAWWFYADALNSRPANDPVTVFNVGELTQRLLSTVDNTSVSVGVNAAALNKAGAVLSDDPVTLCWSGNRLCPPTMLTPQEHTRLFS